jgi:hypothetical protein
MIGFIGHFDTARDYTLQFIVKTHTLTSVHSQFIVKTHTLTSVHSLIFTAVARWRLPTADVSLPLGSRTIHGLSFLQQQLTTTEPHQF